MSQFLQLFAKYVDKALFLNISLPGSSFAILAAIAVALAYSLLLYWRAKKTKTSIPKNWRIGLSAIRFLWVAVIVFMLLGPFIKLVKRLSEKPKIVFALDDTESMLQSSDSNQIRSLYKRIQNEEIEGLEAYDLRISSFSSTNGDNLKIEGKSTDISKALKQVKNKFDGANVSAVVLISDGIHNQGINPEFTQDVSDYAVYSLIAGDTTVKQDLSIQTLVHNDFVYQGNDFPIKASVLATNYNGGKTILEVYKAGKKIDETPINIESQNHYSEHNFYFNAEKPGVNRYDFRLKPLNKEENTANNSKSAFIDVIDASKKVLLLAEGPHPDIGMLNRMLGRNKNYETEIAFLSNLEADIKAEDFKKYNLVITHSIPTQKKHRTQLEALKAAKIPVWFIIAENTDVEILSAAGFGLQTDGPTGIVNNTFPTLSNSFSLFDASKEFYQKLKEYPPVVSTLYRLSFAGQSHNMLQQQIGNVASDYPLQTFWQHSNIKYGILQGVNFWRWASYEYKENKNYEKLDESLGQIIQYLTVKADKRQFRVKMQKRIFGEGERIKLQGELFDKNYKPYMKGAINLTVVEEQGTEYSFNFSPKTDYYEVDLGKLPEGNYTFTASASINNETLKTSGAFAVKSQNRELAQTVANHKLLKQLSYRTGGKAFKFDEFENLIAEFNNETLQSSVVREKEELSLLINKKIIAILIILLMSVEWGIRKFLGSY